MSRIFTLILIALFPLEAHVSGTQPVSGIADFVFVELRVGLKVIKDAHDAGHQWNLKRLATAKEEAQALAKKVKLVAEQFRKTNSGFEFLPVETNYDFYESGMVGYIKFPTLSSDEEAKANQSKPCYFQLHMDPLVVIHFKSLPSLDVLNGLKAVVGAAVPSKQAY